jgi:ribonuclease J
LPGSLSSQSVRIVPLGGLGEIGLNCLAIEQDDGIMVVDCGAGFPEDDLGVDVLHPDFSWLIARRSEISGVFLTHGHEDHVGGLPYLLAELDVPVYGPPHALGVARRRLVEHDFGNEDLDFHDAHPGQRYELGPFSVEPIRVAHSIVEASALLIRTKAGSILHTGDFNFDPAPPDGEPTDELRLSELGDEGVALLMSDSTNVDIEQRAGSEREVARAVEQIVEGAPGRVVIAMFASNIQRLISFGEMARRLGRKLCLLGRSLESQVSLATEIGRLHWPSDLLVAPEQARDMPRKELLILAGGTQAERNSAMRRLASGIHPALELTPGDTVIMSGRAIPGNERPVMHLINDLLRLGVDVRSKITDSGVHTSGHAGRSEQRHMLELVRPRCFIPLHGTLHHLRRHAELARSVGLESTLVVENGTPVLCDGGSLRREEEIAHGVVHVAYGGEPLEPAMLNTRAELGRYGVVFVSAAFERGKLSAPPAIVSRGVPRVDDNDAAARTLGLELARALETFRPGRGLEREEWARRAIRRKIEELSGTRPNVELRLIELD